MTRRSPVRHEVSEHYRNGQIIHDYKRGKGKRQEKPRKVVGIKPVGSDGFTVALDGQTYSLGGRSFTAAVRAAFREYSGDMPRKVTITR